MKGSLQTQLPTGSGHFKVYPRTGLAKQDSPKPGESYETGGSKADRRWGQLQADFSLTLGRLGADLGPTWGRLWASSLLAQNDEQTYVFFTFFRCQARFTPPEKGALNENSSLALLAEIL